jgi:hypothetical protein
VKIWLLSPQHFSEEGCLLATKKNTTLFYIFLAFKRRAAAAAGWGEWLREKV